MNLLGRVASILSAVALSSAALIHAASENDVLLSSNNALLRLGLTAEVVSNTVDRSFREQFSQASARGHNEIPQVPTSLYNIAGRAFLADPLEVATIRTIALGSLVQLDRTRARQLMQVSTEISKRDSITNLWLAQDLGNRGDMRGMMNAFDHALRTSTRTRWTAMEPLVNLLVDPDSHAPLGDLLKRQPEWESAFWYEFSRNSSSVGMAEKFFRTTSLSLDRLEPAARARLFSNLESAGRFGAIFDLVALEAGSRTDAALKPAGFSVADERNPLGWKLYSEGRYSTAVHLASGELQIDARDGSFGLAGEQIVSLGEENVVRIEMASPVPENATVGLDIVCARSGDSFGEIRLSSTELVGQSRFAANNCAFGYLRLSFRVNPGRTGAVLRIKTIKVDRI